MPEPELHYSREWAESKVLAYTETYPRATSLCGEILGITHGDVVKALCSSYNAWNRYKQIIKTVNNWLVCYGDAYLRELGATSFLADLRAFMARGNLLHKCIVLTDPWRRDSLIEHKTIGASLDVGTPAEREASFSRGFSSGGSGELPEDFYGIERGVEES